MKMFEFSKNKLSITDIWAAGFDLYKQTVLKVWYLAFIMMAVLLIVFNYAVQITKVDTDQAKASLTTINWSTPTIIAYIIGLLVTIFIISVILHRIYNLAFNPNYRLVDSLRFVLSKFLIIFSCMVLVYIIVAAGLMLFIVPGIFVGILLIFSLLFILFENAGWLSAIKQSVLLVWGNWWRTFAVILMPALLLLIIQNIVSVIIGMRLLWLNVLITSLVVSFVKPFFDAVVLVQFNDLKARTRIKGLKD
jgi:hypothetical protein